MRLSLSSLLYCIIFTLFCSTRDGVGNRTAMHLVNKIISVYLKLYFTYLQQSEVSEHFFATKNNLGLDNRYLHGE